MKKQCDIRLASTWVILYHNNNIIFKIIQGDVTITII